MIRLDFRSTPDHCSRRPATGPLRAQRPATPCARQGGIALVVALILLVVITLVGLAAVNGTIMQNKMAANQHDREIAFQAAEAALRQAQVVITTRASRATPAPAGIEDCSTPNGNVTPTNTCAPNPFDDAGAGNFVTDVPTEVFNPGPLSAGQPQYVIQYTGRFLAPPRDIHTTSSSSYADPTQSTPLADYYRITARSADPADLGDRAVVVLQSVFQN